MTLPETLAKHPELEKELLKASKIIKKAGVSVEDYGKAIRVMRDELLTLIDNQ